MSSKNIFSFTEIHQTKAKDIWIGRENIGLWSFKWTIIIKVLQFRLGRWLNFIKWGIKISLFDKIQPNKRGKLHREGCSLGISLNFTRWGFRLHMIFSSKIWLEDKKSLCLFDCFIIKT